MNVLVQVLSLRPTVVLLTTALLVKAPHHAQSDRIRTAQDFKVHHNVRAARLVSIARGLGFQGLVEHVMLVSSAQEGQRTPPRQLAHRAFTAWSEHLHPRHAHLERLDQELDLPQSLNAQPARLESSALDSVC
jgi:hypothetical protein